MWGSQPGRSTPVHAKVWVVRGPTPYGGQNVQGEIPDPVRRQKETMEERDGGSLRNGVSPPPQSSEIKNKLQQAPPQEHRERSRSRVRSSSRGRSCSRTRSRSRSRGRSGSQCRGSQVRFKSRSRSCSRDRRPEYHPTWADRVRGTPEKVTRGLPPEHDRGNNRLAQLERENEMMKNTIARLVTEISEIKRGSNRRPAMADKQPATPQPMEVPMVETSDTERPAKKRAITNEPERASGRAKSEIREMLSALSDSIKEINEKFSLFQSNMASMEERTNQRISKIASFLENVVAPVMVPKAPTPPTTASTSNSTGAIGPPKVSTAAPKQYDGHSN
ncbi:serine/arginine-rich splicing factor 6-like [Dermacentor silvarum]|uniref:serine/arginine-rich splicing factor 6-like n=1 Tax=Dermacentor silvarum TaxID=543639 RepID=UPI00189A5E16|nr:serine/arginine-rich splicing factor 6-like [Dermacentor silvarum]